VRVRPERLPIQAFVQMTFSALGRGRLLKRVAVAAGLLFVLLSAGCTEQPHIEALQAAIVLHGQKPEIFEGEEFYFYGDASGGVAPYTYRWTFGRGISGRSEKEPGKIVFDYESVYKVILSVKDAEGNMAETFVVIDVKHKPDFLL